MKKHAVGIIGFGGMARYHVNTLKNYGRAYFKGVWDVSPHSLELAESMGLICYNSAEELLHDSEIDLVLIATTNEVHKELTIKALKAGKHVLCEKPAALNADDFAQMTDVAKKCNKVLTVDQNRRTNRDFLLMKKKVEEGVIGEPYVIESRVEAARGMSAWRTVKRLGGGIMLDWGVHLIDQILCMTDQKIVSVYCKMYKIKYPEVEDNASLTLSFENGLTAIIEIGTNNYITHPRWYVLGKNGSLQIDDWECNGRIVKRGAQKDVFNEEIIYTNAGPTKTMIPMFPNETQTISIAATDDMIDDFSAVYDQFINAVEGISELTIKPEQTLRVMKIIDAAFQSGERGDVIKGCF